MIPGVDKKRVVQQQAAHLAYLEAHPYEQFSAEELREAREALAREADTVRAGMAHGDLGLDAYTCVWEECLAQVPHVHYL